MYGMRLMLIGNRDLRKYTSILIIMVLICFLYFVLTSSFKTGNATIDYFLTRTRATLNWTNDAGNIGRINRWNWAISLYQQKKFTGIGPAKTGSWGEASMGVTESGILKRLCELGIIGCGMHYILVLSIVIGGIKVFLKKGTDIIHKKYELMLFFGILCSILINDITLQSTEETSISFLMWFILGCIALEYEKSSLGEYNG